MKDHFPARKYFPFNRKVLSFYSPFTDPPSWTIRRENEINCFVAEADLALDAITGSNRVVFERRRTISVLNPRRPGYFLEKPNELREITQAFFLSRSGTSGNFTNASDGSLTRSEGNEFVFEMEPQDPFLRLTRRERGCENPLVGV